MKNLRMVSFFAGALFLSGCAWYSIKPIPASEAAGADWGKKSCNGYVFYQPELYFSVTIESVKAGTQPAGQNLTVTPLYLPNYKKPYRLSTHNVFAKADFEFGFQNGWMLTQIADKSDNSAVASTLAGELKTMLTTGAAALKFGPTNAPPQKRVLLYHPRFDLQTGYFNGFDEVGAVEESE